MLPLAIATAAFMLYAWFPIGTLIHQQSQIDAVTAQISAVKQQEHSLKVQAKSVSSTAVATQLAREQYQLVNPGQSLIQVLPGNGSGQVSQSTGDPGLQPLVSPSSAPSLTLGTVPTVTVKKTPNFLTRLLHTLEFWH